MVSNKGKAWHSTSPQGPTWGSFSVAWVDNSALSDVFMHPFCSRKRHFPFSDMFHFFIFFPSFFFVGFFFPLYLCCHTKPNLDVPHPRFYLLGQKTFNQRVKDERLFRQYRENKKAELKYQHKK